MNTHRISFLESLAQNSASMKIVFLNHSGAPANLVADISSIDLLADKKATAAFINFCECHSMVSEIRISPEFRRTEIIVKFTDSTELRFMLLRDMIRKAFSCMHFDEVRRDALTNDHGMRVASNSHHFEYLFLMCQFAQISMPDRYRNYFGSFDFETRTTIFRYIQPRYDLVINTLDELYQPKGSTQLKMMMGLRRDKMNSLFKMFLRVVEYGIFTFLRNFTKKVIVKTHTPGNISTGTTPIKNRNTAGQAVL